MPNLPIFRPLLWYSFGVTLLSTRAITRERSGEPYPHVQCYPEASARKDASESPVKDPQSHTQRIHPAHFEGLFCLILTIASTLVNLMKRSPRSQVLEKQQNHRSTIRQSLPACRSFGSHISKGCEFGSV